MDISDIALNNSLLVVITDKGKGSDVLRYASELGIRGATAFHARGTVTNKILKLLELHEVRKEVIMIALPAEYVEEAIEKLTLRFHFDQPNKGIMFTLSLSHVYGSRYFETCSECVIEGTYCTPCQAVMTIVDKGKADEVLDFVEKEGFPRGTVIDAHGSADKSKKVFNLMLESEKEIILTVVTHKQAQQMKRLLTDYLNLISENSGILAIFNITRQVGVTFNNDDKSDKLVLKETSESENTLGYSAIFAIVNDDMDEAVIHSAEDAGSTGGTIIHARGSRPYSENPFDGFESEREIVLIIARNDKIRDICNNIINDLHLDKHGNGILFVTPLCDVSGLVPH